MCIYGGYMCICTPIVKFLCLTLCQGEVCTDDAANAAYTNDDTRWTINDCIRLFG